MAPPDPVAHDVLSSGLHLREDRGAVGSILHKAMHLFLWKVQKYNRIQLARTAVVIYNILQFIFMVNFTTPVTFSLIKTLVLSCLQFTKLALSHVLSYTIDYL